jgi:type I restriction enzyme S subunit
MTGDLKPYPTTKDSGAPWLGEVPEHWEVRRLDTLFVLRREDPLDDDRRVTGYLDGRVTLRSNVQGQKIKGVIKEAGWQRIHPGDFAISGMNAHLGGMGVSDSLGRCSPIYLVLKPKSSTNAKFISLAVRRMAHSGLLKSLVSTIRFNSADFKRDDLKQIQVWFPSLPEQSAIVRFLDHAEHRTRRYIRAKQKLIKLLKEQKQAIIHRAVTRGLDPNVRLKPSGVAWLGDVPEHWEVKRLRSLVNGIDQGVSPQAEARLAENGAWGVLKAGCVNHGVFRDSEHKRLPDGFPVDSALAVHVGDVLVSRASGSPQLVGSAGRVEVLRYRLILSDKTFRLLFCDERIVAFAVAAMNARYFRIQVEQAISGAEGLANNLPLSSLKGLRLAIPPGNEAQIISSSLKDQTRGVEQLIDRAEREISLLREYRTRLIADVVTGKLDVREAAAQLRDEPEGIEAIDEGKTLAEGDNVEDAESEAVPGEVEA